MIYFYAILLLIINFWLFNITGLIITFFLFAYITFARKYVLYIYIPFLRKFIEENQDLKIDIINNIEKFISYVGVDKYTNYKHYKVSTYLRTAFLFFLFYILIKKFKK
jgi:hypothetical protein